MSNPISRNWWFPLLFAIVLAAGMFFGYRLQDNRASFIFRGGQLLSGPKADNPFQETIDLIKKSYVEKVDLDEKYAVAIEALLAELDPHSYYIPKSDLQGVQEEMTGNFEGIGIEFFVVKDTVQVVSPIPGGPSYQLGIMSGDKIIQVNDTLIAGVGIQNDQVIRKLKGPKGTKVKVSVQRYGVKDLIEFNITRDKIPIYSVEGGFLLNDSVGYIKVSRFSETTASEFLMKLSALSLQGMKHLVLDLRENPGGYLQQAVQLSDFFLDEGKAVVYTEGRSMPRYTYKTEEEAYFKDGNIAVLIDEGSASASEILAGAIQDWDRGVVIGRRSFGKGLVQDQYELKDGSAIRLTIAKYYTPSGRSIQKPYVNGDKEYENDMTKRFEDGELWDTDNKSALSKQDTSVKYYTKVLKRPVFGGGGIMPDIFVPVDTSYLNEFSIHALSAGLLQEFTYEYFSKNQKEFDKFEDFSAFNTGFQVSESFYASFVKYCQQKGVKSTKSAYAAPVKKDMMLRLKAYLARQAFGREGYLQVAVERDASVEKALQVLKKASILSGL
jgi:carboxyl-terminal processing protease